MAGDEDATIGWDIGGAHLKAARIENGRVLAARQAPTPLWRGLDSLEAAFATLRAELGPATQHVATMTGELCDAFASRAEGVAGLAAIAARALAPARLRIYAGRGGFVAPEAAGACAADVASANWHASAAVAARQLAAGVLIDIGSTTADLVPFAGGRVAAVGYADGERLAAGELVYAGLTRSFVMAMARRAPFRGAWTPLMNEYFAASADVYRLLGALPEGADQMASADGREKSAEASAARLARMIGREAAEGEAAEWRGLAAWFAEAQIRDVADALALRLSRGDVALDAPLVAAGIGAALVAEIARRAGRGSVDYASLIDVAPQARAAAAQCAPAVAVALLAENAA